MSSLRPRTLPAGFVAPCLPPCAPLGFHLPLTVTGPTYCARGRPRGGAPLRGPRSAAPSGHDRGTCELSAERPDPPWSVSVRPKAGRGQATSIIASVETTDDRNQPSTSAEITVRIEVPGSGVVSGRAARGSAPRKATCGPLLGMMFHTVQGCQPARIQQSEGRRSCGPSLGLGRNDAPQRRTSTLSQPL